VYMAM